MTIWEINLHRILKLKLTSYLVYHTLLSRAINTPNVSGIDPDVSEFTFSAWPFLTKLENLQLGSRLARSTILVQRADTHRFGS